MEKKIIKLQERTLGRYKQYFPKTAYTFNGILFMELDKLILKYKRTKSQEETSQSNDIKMFNKVINN